MWIASDWLRNAGLEFLVLEIVHINDNILQYYQHNRNSLSESGCHNDDFKVLWVRVRLELCTCVWRALRLAPLLESRPVIITGRRPCPFGHISPTDTHIPIYTRCLTNYLSMLTMIVGYKCCHFNVTRHVHTQERYFRSIKRYLGGTSSYRKIFLYWISM